MENSVEESRVLVQEFFNKYYGHERTFSNASKEFGSNFGGLGSDVAAKVEIYTNLENNGECNKDNAEFIFGENLVGIGNVTDKIKVFEVAYGRILRDDVDSQLQRRDCISYLLCRKERITSLGWAENVFGKKLGSLNDREKAEFIDVVLYSYRDQAERYVNNGAPIRVYVANQYGISVNYVNNRNDGQNDSGCIVF